MGVEPIAKPSADCFSPQEIEANVEKMGVKKARSPIAASLLQAFLAGIYIGLGGLFFCIVLADSTLGFAAQRLLGGPGRVGRAPCALPRAQPDQARRRPAQAGPGPRLRPRGRSSSCRSSP